MKKTLIFYLSVFSLLFVSDALFSQRRVALIVTGVVEVNNEPVPNGDIRVYQDRHLLERLSTNAAGGFEFYLQFDRDYVVHFSAPGMITKKIKFDAHLPERASRRSSYLFEFVVDLFPYVDGVDLSFFDEPFVTIEYDSERSRDFVFPAQKYSSNLSKVASLKREVEAYLRKDERYNDLVKRADELYNREEYRNALNYYVNANEIFSDREHPIARIKAINEILARRDELQEDYQHLIALADRSFSLENYEEAIEHYTSALGVRPNESYPRQRIEEARRLIAQATQQAEQARRQAEQASQQQAQRESAAREQARQQAELARQQQDQREAAAREQARQDSILRAQTALNQRYNRLIALADNHFDNNQLTQARNYYTEALQVKPGEAHPRERLLMINRRLRQTMESETLYANAIKRGDSLFGLRRYQTSMAAYKEALEVKPGEAYPASQIEKITSLLAEMRQQDEAYNALIRNADNLFSGRNYTGAKVEYEKALAIKPGEAHPRQRIEEINSILGRQDRELAAYNTAIRRGDQFFNAQNYIQAREAYREALAMRPGEAYPTNQITAIGKLLADMQQQDNVYLGLIKTADSLFTRRSYERAKAEYEKALELKPGEAHPRQRIEEINSIIGRQDRELAAYNAAIRRGDQFFNQKNYTQARDAYRDALALRPGETYPRNRLTEIDALLQAAYSESLSYRQNIELGDRLLSQRQYFPARDAYHRALNINPGAQYPIEKIMEINELILRSEEMNAFYSRGYMEVSGVKELIENNSTNTYYIVPFTRQRSGSYIEMKVINNSDRNVRVFVNYGVNRSRHGGIAVLVSPSTNYQSIKLNVSSQPSWIRFDNNWISLSPVGGDIEVENINIVFGDQ